MRCALCQGTRVCARLHLRLCAFARVRSCSYCLFLLARVQQLKPKKRAHAECEGAPQITGPPQCAVGFCSGLKGGFTAALALPVNQTSAVIVMDGVFALEARVSWQLCRPSLRYLKMIEIACRGSSNLVSPSR